MQPHTYNITQQHPSPVPAVWNENFIFNILNENAISFVVKDEDLIKDDIIVSVPPHHWLPLAQPVDWCTARPTDCPMLCPCVHPHR